MRYILSLTAKNPQNNMVLECDDEAEKAKYLRAATLQGYKVTVKEVEDGEDN